MNKTRLLATTAAILFLGACTAGTPPTKNMDIINGPPVSDINTPYDDALTCAANSLSARSNLMVVGVGEIADATGKASISDGGNGAFITQAAGDQMQSAFYKATPDHVVNRRDPRVMQLESSLGANFNIAYSDVHATGSINTLDFVPGGGIEVNVAGIGGDARQYRMVVGLDVSLTDTRTSKIIAVSSLHKQIVAYDYGFGIGRFFGDTLVTMNIGEQQREAVGLAARNMIKHATFDLLEDVYGDMPECRAIIKGVEDVEDTEDLAMLEIDIANYVESQNSLNHNTGYNRENN